MKYLRTFFLALQSEFMSRANIIGWFLIGLIPSITLILVWFAILGQRTSLNGFTKGDFIVYYLFTAVCWYIVGGTFGRSVGNKIKNGTINTSLIKPYNIVLGQCVQEQAWKVLSIIVSIPVTVVILYIFRDIVHINFSLEQIALLIISLILGGINFALTEALIGISAFWVTEVWPVAQVNDIMQSLFGGRYVPLTLLPTPILFLSNILPFKYMFYVPLSILLSKSVNPLLDIGVQFLYVFVLVGIYKMVWKSGIKKYESVGI